MDEDDLGEFRTREELQVILADDEQENEEPESGDRRPRKWGFKLFMLCSLMGYAYKFIIYSGKDNDPMFENETYVGVVGNVVIKFCREIQRRVNHSVL